MLNNGDMFGNPYLVVDPSTGNLEQNSIAIPGQENGVAVTSQGNSNIASSLGLSSENYALLKYLMNYESDMYNSVVENNKNSAATANEFASSEAEAARKFNAEQALLSWERSEQSAENAFERQKQLLDYQNSLNLANRKTAYQDMVADLKASGLNPAFWMGSSAQSVNSSASSVASGSSSAASSGAASASQAYSANRDISSFSSMLSSLVKTSTDASMDVFGKIFDVGSQLGLAYLSYKTGIPFTSGKGIYNSVIKFYNKK